MKKNLLTLFIAVSSVCLVYAQSLTVTSPGLDEQGLEFQRGAEFLFEGTVDDYTNVDSIGCYLIYEGHSGNWSKTIHMGKITLTANTYTDTFSIPLTADLPSPDTSNHTIETRAYFTPSTQLYEQVSITVIEEYTSWDGLILDLPEADDSNPYYIQLKRGEYFKLTGTYGLKDLDSVSVWLYERPDGLPINDRIKQLYSNISNGYYADSIYIDPSYPISGVNDDYIIAGIAYYNLDMRYNVFSKVVTDYTVDYVNIKDSSFVSVGKKDTLVAIVWPEGAADKSVTWSSMNNSIATVNSAGVVEGVAAGETKIIVTTTQNSIRDTCIVTVATYPVEGVSVSPVSVSIDEGEATTLNVTLDPVHATNDSVSWVSANTSVATVSNAGVVTGISEGSTTVTVTTDDGGYTATCSVTVNDTNTITVTETLLVDVNIYPNPATNEINIAGLEQGTYGLSVYNVLGMRYVNTYIEVNGVYVLPVENLYAGTYILMLSNEEATLSRKVNITR